MAPPLCSLHRDRDRHRAARVAVTAVLVALAAVQGSGSTFVSVGRLQQQVAAPLRRPSTAVGPWMPSVPPGASSTASRTSCALLAVAAAGMAAAAHLASLRGTRRSPLALAGTRVTCCLSAPPPPPQVRCHVQRFGHAAGMTAPTEEQAEGLWEKRIPAMAWQADCASIFAGASTPWIPAPTRSAPTPKAEAEAEAPFSRRRPMGCGDRRKRRSRRSARSARASGPGSEADSRRLRRRSGARLLRRAAGLLEPECKPMAFDASKVRSKVQRGILRTSTARKGGSCREAVTKSESATPAGYSDCHRSVRVDCCKAQRSSK
mmetsp:Transcript_32312/g.57936  ORF Transcript_32312/g.57936 Transcript_32312/m.57936 type:complete len:319 (-) Transcript_32312:172-1128(-)